MPENKIIFEENYRAVVSIVTIAPGGETVIRGTGFIIDDKGTLLTNAHVYSEVPDAERIHLRALVFEEVQNGNTVLHPHEISFVKKDDQTDIALLQIANDPKSKNIYHAIKGTEEEIMTEGEDIVFIGYPLGNQLYRSKFGLTLFINRGMIGAVRRQASNGELNYYLLDVHVNPGSSGSPVFSSRTGKVIGIASGYIGQSFATDPAGKTPAIQVSNNIGICRPIGTALNIK